jgi:hypothetical protein
MKLRPVLGSITFRQAGGASRSRQGLDDAVITISATPSVALRLCAGDACAKSGLQIHSARLAAVLG